MPIDESRRQGRYSCHPQQATNALGVNNNHDLYTHLSFRIRGYEWQLVAMRTAHQSAIYMKHEQHFTAHLHHDEVVESGK